jgi:hypothetical protein
MVAIWVALPSSILEEHSASILSPNQNAMQCNNPEDDHLCSHCNETATPKVVWVVKYLIERDKAYLLDQTAM